MNINLLSRAQIREIHAVIYEKNESAVAPADSLHQLISLFSGLAVKKSNMWRSVAVIHHSLPHMSRFQRPFSMDLLFGSHLSSYRDMMGINRIKPNCLILDVNAAKQLLHHRRHGCSVLSYKRICVLVDETPADMDLIEKLRGCADRVNVYHAQTMD